MKPAKKRYEAAFNIAIKYGFCGDCDWKYKGNHCRDCDCYVNAVKPLEDLTRKADKYRWHDLRVNKEDLPEDIEVLFKDYIGTYYIGYFHNGCGCFDSNGYFHNNFGWYDSDNLYKCNTNEVVAWKYIEEFEGEIND